MAGCLSAAEIKHPSPQTATETTKTSQSTLRPACVCGLRGVFAKVCVWGECVVYVCVALALFALVGKLNCSVSFRSLLFYLHCSGAARILWKEFICSTAFMRANCLLFLVASIVPGTKVLPKRLPNALQVAKRISSINHKNRM